MADGSNNGTIQQFNSCYTGQTQAETTIEKAKQMPVIYNEMLLNKLVMKIMYYKIVLAQ